MGMVIFLGLAIYIAISIVIYKAIKKLNNILVNRLTLAILILLPTYDIIITNILSAYYCNTSPNPKTYIEKKVEYPISIYWEDNVYPGFNKADRELMIKNYLDGVHLKTMALNGDDGKVYVYSCEKDISMYKKSLQEKKIEENKLVKVNNEYSILLKQRRDLIKTKKILTKEDVDKLPQEDKENLLYLYEIWMGSNFKTWNRYVVNTPDIKKITTKIEKLNKDKTKIKSENKEYFKDFSNQCMQNEKIYTKATMPKLNYTVTFNEVKLNSLSSKFLYSDETQIIENNTSKVIAYNQRYMRFFYNILPDLVLGDRYYSEVMCGGKKFIPYWIFGYVEEMLDGKIKLTDKVKNTGIHKLSRNQKLYKKYIKGEK